MSLNATKLVRSINGVVVKQPTDMNFEDYPLTKSGRVASGDMTAELIRYVRTFILEYEVLSGTEFEVIKAAIHGGTFFFVFAYVDNNVEKTATVYPGAIKRTKFRTDGVWYWKKVSFSLIEK